MAHGWRILVIDGVTSTAAHFTVLNIPQPGLSAWLAGLSQVACGALLVVGLLSTLMAGVLALLMVAAIYFVHLPHGVFTDVGGWEYPLVLVMALGMIIVFGGGRASIDGVLGR